MEQLDVKTAFLHGELEETIFMKQSEGYSRTNDENKVCLLKKSLYGLKKSPRQWYKRFDKFMTQIHFIRDRFNSRVYMKNGDGQAKTLFLLYVDEMLIANKKKVIFKLLKGD